MIRLANYGGQPYVGWVRTKTDETWPESWELHDTIGVMGSAEGDARVVDVRVRLQPGQVLELDPALARSVPFTIGGLPANVLGHFGLPTIGDQDLTVESVRQDGAAYVVKLFAGLQGELLTANVWLWWYPDQPGWCHGEVLVCASDPSIPDMVATIPADFTLRLGKAHVIIPGLTLGAPLLPAGETLADGQVRAFPFCAIWPEHLTISDYNSADIARQFLVAANGITNLWPGGYPALPVWASALGWTRQHLAGAIARLHGWDFGPLGPVASGGQTGSQEDQVFVGGEAAGTLGLGAELVRYFVALGTMRRPIHHCDETGLPQEPAEHPGCVLWSGRPFWPTSTDRLGKLRELNAERDESHGITGQDRQHWLLNTVAVAARLRYSPALQWELGHQGRHFVWQETVEPWRATSDFDSARSIGWAGLLVVHLWRNLADRALAERVAERWRQRVRQVYIPRLAGKPGSIWDPRADDRIRWEIGLHWVQGWMPEQQSVGCYGLDLACELVGPPEGRALALAGAHAVLRRAFFREGDRWVEWERLGYLGNETVLPAEGAGGHRTGWYRAAWFPLATATVLRHDPGHERARSIWAQQLADGGGGGSWFPPEVVR
jgi:hypothetical protein